MAATTVLIVILIILSASFLLERSLSWLNLTAMTAELPGLLKGIYDPKKYAKSQEYTRVRTRFGMISGTFSFVIVLVVLVTGALGKLDSFLLPEFEDPKIRALAFFGILFILNDLVSLPFSIYSTFVIEEKFGFNKTTAATFIADKLKGYALGVVIGGGILFFLLWLIESLGSNFWIVFWVAISLFMLLMQFFYVFLLPLFNKLRPLAEVPDFNSETVKKSLEKEKKDLKHTGKDEERGTLSIEDSLAQAKKKWEELKAKESSLRTKIEAYAGKVGFPLTKIQVINGSKRSNKSNAFFTGFGKNKRVVLYDTLITNHTEEELVAILAHEVGHYKKRHVIQGYLIGVLQMGLTFFILSLFLDSHALTEALGGKAETDYISIPLNLIAFGFLYSPLSEVLGLAMNLLSRKNEYEADAFAAETYDSSSIAEGLKRIHTDNLSNLSPHPLYVWWHYSHPTLLQRLKALGQA